MPCARVDDVRDDEPSWQPLSALPLTVIAAEGVRLARDHLNNLREAHSYRLDDASVARVISTWEVTRDDLTSCSRNRVAGGNSGHAVAGGRPGVETPLSSPRNAASSRTSTPSSTSYRPSRSNVYAGLSCSGTGSPGKG